jgi:hypothetical protein
MRHIAVPGFAALPCHGLIEEIPRPPSPPSAAPGHRSLPIVNAEGRQLFAAGAAASPTLWICRGCGKTWDREPLPDEAL